LARSLLRRCGPKLLRAVDIIEQLPVPFGLLRYGVAPDHQEVKVAQNELEDLAVTESRLGFCGNVPINTLESVNYLRDNYDSVVFAHGADRERRLGIPGENLSGVVSAGSFVKWYNGHPFGGAMEAPGRPHLSDVEKVVIVGQGNVAMDCCRMLVERTSVLEKTDIAGE
jgi:NADPH-dependent glutamate synthase beta subunit-like oxidoreductase